ncbi:MAG: 2-oxoglutarate dehydrogenase E1 component [Myxococcota bacterium]|jgi:2-oxoglutarate dehydrogenase E1 component|nr:2-oxoglutarate dehydrogenase E1 component [Myxococcota bacterium]
MAEAIEHTDDDSDEPTAPESPFNDFGINAGFVEEIHRNYQVDPQSVDESWSDAFGGGPAPARPQPAAPRASGNGSATAAAAAPPSPAPQATPPAVPAPAGPTAEAPHGNPRGPRVAAALDRDARLMHDDKNARVLRLIHSYRARGHRIARSDPLSVQKKYFPELDPAHYGFSNHDLDEHFTAGDLPGGSVQTLRDILTRLGNTYCGSIGVEYTHVQDPGRKLWLQQQMERDENRPRIEPGQLARVYHKLCEAEMFEQFLHTKFLGQKRFSLEGGEVVIPLLDHIIERAPRHGIVEYVLGMSHRGRLNVLANVMRKPLDVIFSEFQDSPDLDLPFGSGDVKYHKGFSMDLRVASGERIHLSLTSNPSHLEAVNPVVEGRARAKQVRMHDMEGERVVPIILHGDAAFAGQGIVAETLNLAQLEGYSTGGTIHIIINNQIGFTTTPAEARSTLYCTDVAKMIQIPIFHVNGDDPEAVLHCADLAMQYRERFGNDVVIDVVCYRRHGHNEGDEPAFTQPRLYARIRDRDSVRKLFGTAVVERGEVSEQEVQQIEAGVRAELETALETANVGSVDPAEPHEPQGPWTGYSRTRIQDDIDTRVSVETLAKVAEGVGSVPDYFRPHSKLLGLLERRRKMIAEGTPIDWAMGEAFAFGTLLLEGNAVRLSGQDCSRGTFSHRHAVFVDQDSGEEFIPLDHITKQQAHFEVYDSLLSEAAVLGFEYGYSLADPATLTLWEAQFGDFANGAQVIIDQFIGSAHVKWGRMSGLVMLLPHGYEGQGPEHSSARIERYLQICAEGSIQVVNCTTPAQYFHVLRRQMRRGYRAPLVIFTPKSLLRLPAATSTIADFSDRIFEQVIDDERACAAADRVERVLMCSGKVYYDLVAERKKRWEDGHDEVAILRVEQLYPWPEERLQALFAQYPNAERVTWVQEEPANMGAWTFVRERIQDLLGPNSKLAYAGRQPSASTAVGSTRLHLKEQAALVDAAFEGLG